MAEKWSFEYIERHANKCSVSIFPKMYSSSAVIAVITPSYAPRSPPFNRCTSSQETLQRATERIFTPHCSRNLAIIGSILKLNLSSLLFPLRRRSEYPANQAENDSNGRDCQVSGTIEKSLVCRALDSLSVMKGLTECSNGTLSIRAVVVVSDKRHSLARSLERIRSLRSSNSFLSTNFAANGICLEYGSTTAKSQRNSRKPGDSLPVALETSTIRD